MAEAAKGPAVQGAEKEHMDQGQGVEGAPKAPEASNVPPVEKPAEKPAKPEGMDEELGVPDTPEDKAKLAAAEAAAVAAKAADEAAAKEAAEKAKVPDAPLTEYIELDHPAGQAAINMLKEAEIPVNEANAIFAKAVESGNLADIDLATLEAKVGKDKATLIMAGVTAYHTETSAKNALTVSAVHEILGGEEQWNTVRDWAKQAETADPAIKLRVDQVRGMIEQGGIYAESGARELLRMYNAAPDTKGLGTTQELTTGKPGEVTAQPLTRADYMVELHKAHNAGATQATIAALDARRMAGKAAGI